MEITRQNLLTLINDGVKRLSLSVSALERSAGVPKDTVRDFLRGKTQILRADKLQKIMRVLGPKETVTVSGYLDNGTAVVPASNLDDQVPCPPGWAPDDVQAIRVRGSGMLPMFHDGWILFYSRNADAAPLRTGGLQVPYNRPESLPGEPFAPFINKPCVAGLSNGEIVAGTLKREQEGKGYRVTNFNTTDLRHVVPEWAARIVYIKTE